MLSIPRRSFVLCGATTYPEVRHARNFHGDATVALVPGRDPSVIAHTLARRFAVTVGTAGPIVPAEGVAHAFAEARTAADTLITLGRSGHGAALADLGFDPDMLRGFALLARTAGLLGHLAEEIRRPAGQQIYRRTDESVRYAPPEP